MGIHLMPPLYKMVMAPPPPPPAPTGFESYTTEPPTQTEDVWDDEWKGQTFTPIMPHTVTHVRLRLRKNLEAATPGIVVFSIRATTAGGVPTGPDLCSGSINGNTLGWTYPEPYYTIGLGNGVDLTSNITYAIVWRAPDGDGTNYVLSRLGPIDPGYPRGMFWRSLNGGVSWSPPDTRKDFHFEELGALYNGAYKLLLPLGYDADDAYTYGGARRETRDYVYLNYNSVSSMYGGFRFRGAPIHQGSTIDWAYLQVQPYATNFDAACTIYGEDVDNSAIIEGGTLLDNRELTTASVPWSATLTGGQFNNSPDIKAIIEEIVNRPGWGYGNSLSIITKDTQSAVLCTVYDYQGNAALAARLSLLYHK